MDEVLPRQQTGRPGMDMDCQPCGNEPAGSVVESISTVCQGQAPKSESPYHFPAQLKWKGITNETEINTDGQSGKDTCFGSG